MRPYRGWLPQDSARAAPTLCQAEALPLLGGCGQGKQAVCLRWSTRSAKTSPCFLTFVTSPPFPAPNPPEEANVNHNSASTGPRVSVMAEERTAEKDPDVGRLVTFAGRGWN